MSKNEMKAALQACKLFIDEYEIDGKREKQGRCRKFFEIIKHIRIFLQVTTELLKRVEQLEEETNNSLRRVGLLEQEMNNSKNE